MDKVTFRGARAASGLSQEAFAAAIGCSRQTVAKIEGGKLAVSDKVARAVADLDQGAPAEPAPVAAKPKPAGKAKADPGAIDPRRLPQPYDFASAPEHTRGLRREPVSNQPWGAGPRTDERPAGEGWQRVPGCCRIVKATIPQPLPFTAPQWAGWRGVVTVSGAVYDYETGHRMHEIGRARPDQGRARLALQKGTKRKA